MLNMLEASLPSLIIVFREMLEAGLIVGIVLAATRGVPKRGLWVTGGIGAGVVGALIIAYFMDAISDALDGVGADVFNAGILFFAVGMLIWHNIWMASHGKEMAREMKAVGQQIQTGERSLFALATVIALAILREGSEVVLFLYGMMASGKYTPMDLSVGLVIGIVLVGLLSALMYGGLVMIPLKRFFAVTSAMVTFLAAGLASQGANFLSQSGLVTRFNQVMWDTSWLLPDESLVANILKVLIGYTAQPTALQLVAYCTTVGIIVIAMYTLSGEEQKPHLNKT